MSQEKSATPRSRAEQYRSLVDEIVFNYLDKCDLTHPDGTTEEDIERDLVNPVLSLIDSLTITPSEKTPISTVEAVTKVMTRRCTNPKPIGDSACECCTHHWHILTSAGASDKPSAREQRSDDGEALALLCELATNLPQIVLGPQRTVERVSHDAFGNEGITEYPKFQATVDKVREYLKKHLDHAADREAAK